jgi:hypothetical protein
MNRRHLMKQVKKRESMVYWIGVARAVLLIFFMVVWIGACNVGTDQTPEPKPDPEPEDTNNLTTQLVVVTNTDRHEVVNESRQCVAPLTDGGFVIVWTVGVYPHRDVMMQRVDSQGNLCLKKGGRPVTFSDGDSYNPVVIARPDGGVYVAFSYANEQAIRVKVQGFDKTMTPLWPEPVAASIHKAIWEAQTEPCLTLAPDGGVYVNYCCYIVEEKPQIQCQRLNASGKRMWGEKGISLCGNNEIVSYSRAVPDNSGGLYIFWKNLRDYYASALDPVLIEGQHLTSAGKKTWGNEPKIIRTTNSLATNFYDYFELMAVPDGFGRAIVAWTEHTDTSNSQKEVLAQKVNTDGALLWNNDLILSDPNEYCELDCVIAANDGGVFISTHNFTGASSTRLQMQKLGGDGGKLWGAYGIELSKTEAQGLNYGVYGYFTGKYLNVCWVCQSVPYAPDFKVVMARLEANGTLMDAPGGVVLDNIEEKQFSRGMVYNEFSKEYFVLWEETRLSYPLDNYDIGGAILKKSASSTSAQLSYPAAPLSTAKMPYLPGPFRIDNNGLYPQQPFDLPGQKVVRREDK